MVKCAECGFLTIRDITTGHLVEVDDAYRMEGRVREIGAYRGYQKTPICFAMAWNLMPEVEQAAQKQSKDQSDDSEKYVLRAIQKDRICPPEGKELGFTDYQQGFTPKEHREMLDRKEWRDWQERQRKEDKRWRLIELIVIGIITVVVAGGFTILGAFIERGSLFP
ncbi:hypothetical protein ACFLVX_04335 [Chloroflexota bacterium]